MNYLEAIVKRQSIRKYEKQPIHRANLSFLEERIERINEASKLHLQLIKNENNVFSNVFSAFKNVEYYIALVGDKNDPNLYEKLGYFGEVLVLEATKLELGSCFVCNSFNKKKCDLELDEDEILVGIITIGNYDDSKVKAKDTRGKSIEKLALFSSDAPDYFKEGVRYVYYAPSAYNKKPYVFSFNNGEVTVELKNDKIYSLIDLGVAKLHFELGALGKFALGNKAIFKKNIEDCKKKKK